MKTTFNFLIILTLMLLSNIVYSQSIPSYVPTSGLVGWWGFNGNAQDGSGNGNHGTVNGATLTTDRFGNQNSAYDFDGINDNISFSNVPFVNQITISFWINIPFDGGGITIVQNSPFFPYNTSFATSSRPSNYHQYILYSNNCPLTTQNYYLNQSGSIVNSWHNLIYTIDNNSDCRLYYDGLFQGLYDGSNFENCSNSNTNLRFGGNWVTHDPQWFKGNLDDLGIWNRALTQQEITNLYNSQLPTQTSLCLPTITTTSPSSVGVDSVVIGGNITNDGGSSIVLRGVCYSTSPNPNMGNSRTEDGSGIGSFNTVLRGLNPSTTYYARSYAKNSNGVVVYGNEVSFSTSSITIGSNYAGGIVFYVDGTGQHGLVCAPSNQGTLMWGCNGAIIPNTQLGVGDGYANTQLIVNGCSQRPIAASVCNDLVLNGYDDWYLPSRGELMLMYNNLAYHGLGNFSPLHYWTSSQSYGNPLNTWAINFSFGVNVTIFEGYTCDVRAIRSF